LLVFRGCPGELRPEEVVRAAAPTAFWDRDGTLNVDYGYVASVERFHWREGAREALSAARAAGFRNIVVTNQSGIGRGLYAEADMLALSFEVLAGACIEAVLYCPHAPEAECPARKPSPSMLEAADEAFGVAAEAVVEDEPLDRTLARVLSRLGTA
jgi:D-glycero-D-manno-heptose 1,7-bisphosphate phosphatase